MKWIKEKKKKKEAEILCWGAAWKERARVVRIATTISIMPSCKIIKRTILGGEAESEVNKIPVSDNTIIISRPMDTSHALIYLQLQHQWPMTSSRQRGSTAGGSLHHCYIDTLRNERVKIRKRGVWGGGGGVQQAAASRLGIQDQAILPVPQARSHGGSAHRCQAHFTVFMLHCYN